MPTPATNLRHQRDQLASLLRWAVDTLRARSPEVLGLHPEGSLAAQILAEIEAGNRPGSAGTGKLTLADILHLYDLEGVDGAPDVTIAWTYEDQAAALREGWYLDHKDGAIQRDPDQEQRTPLSILNMVRFKATKGSELHIRAMILDAWAAVGAWETRYREATKQGPADAH